MTELEIKELQEASAKLVKEKLFNEVWSLESVCGDK